MTYLDTNINPCFSETDMTLWQAYLVPPTAKTLTPHSCGTPDWQQSVGARRCRLIAIRLYCVLDGVCNQSIDEIHIMNTTWCMLLACIMLSLLCARDIAKSLRTVCRIFQVCGKQSGFHRD